jgi:hypothetical protein
VGFWSLHTVLGSGWIFQGGLKRIRSEFFESREWDTAWLLLK